MTRQLLIDQNLPAGLGERLGATCRHAEELGPQPSDKSLWIFARDNGYTILTKDADFFDQLTTEGAPPKVIWLRTGNMRKAELEAFLVRVWPRIIALLDQGDLVEVHRDRIESLKF